MKLDKPVSVPVVVITVAVVLVSLTVLYRTLARRQEARQYHSQLGQARWVLEEVFPGVKGGYFVEVGSGDGELLSNTWTLELNGWEGVCIDPFPTNMGRRSCQLFREVVYSSAGKTIEFRPIGLLGGIEDHISSGTEQRDAPSGTVSLQTVTLDDLLERANAPSYIHYLSIDVEGAELEVLKGFSLDRYKVGAFTIEHGYEEPKRTEIRTLLEKNGYRLAQSRHWDDWYLPVEAGPRETHK